METFLDEFETQVQIIANILIKHRLRSKTHTDVGLCSTTSTPND